MPVGLGDIVKVRNNGSRPLKWMWDSRKYIIQPGTEEFVPYECMKLFCGDPRATDHLRSERDVRGVVGYIADRPTEVRRIRMLYDHAFGEYIPGEVNAFDNTRIPNVQVFDLKGNVIPTVLTDPEGTHVTQAVETQSQHDDLISIVQNQGLMIEALCKRLGITNPAAVASASLPPIEEPPEPQMAYNPRTDEVVKKPAPRTSTDEEFEVLDDLPQADD